jgi:hypothetical protein
METFLNQGKMKSIRRETDVFELSDGISLSAWNLINWFYSNSSPDSLIGKIYKQFRKNQNYNNESLILNILGKKIQEQYNNKDGNILVGHPILVPILSKNSHLFYQHGELVTPPESVVKGIQKIFVPTEEAVKPFIDFGYSINDIIITGLCIEPSLVRQVDDAFNARLQRYQSNDVLTGAFYSSGAEPQIHIEILTNMISSIEYSENKMIIFAKREGRFNKRLEKILSNNKACLFIDSTDQIPYELPKILVVTHKNRREENIFTSTLFAHFDYFVAPSHERSNWAMGLGLPMFIINPPIGPYAPMNKELLMSSGVAISIEDKNQSKEFANILSKLYIDGNLFRMAHAGYNQRPIKGFEIIVNFFDNYLT